MIPLNADDHHGHATGILSAFMGMDGPAIAAMWRTGSMAMLSAQRHIDALYEICAETEHENHKLQEQVKQLQEASQ